MNAYEARRLDNIQRNQALVRELGLHKSGITTSAAKKSSQPPSKKRKLNATLHPTRSSARIASAEVRPSYTEDSSTTRSNGQPSKQRRAGAPKFKNEPGQQSDTQALLPLQDITTLRARWTSWTPSAPPPTRDPVTGTLHFPTHPTFRPNKTPEEILREGCFGGSYFRPLRSARLGATVADDWRELPPSWTAGLNVEKYLTSPAYDAEVNKYKVACGQSIEEWEAAGWINHEYDVRGWFQWYCRFWMGRRCEDDERQVGRWRKCVGETGRWRRILLKRYVAAGVRSVFDDGEEGGGEVSPVVHQTCHHWGFEVRQGVLDEFWRTGR